MSQYGTGEVAALLGVHADTVRRWCDEGRIPTVRSEAGTRLIEGHALAEFLVAQPDAFTRETGAELSARNRLTGIVTRVERDGVTAVVELRVGGHRIVSLMTREAADDLGLTPGDLATAVVKATNVIVEVST